MVATVLRLRYRLLANMLTRSPWQLVGFVFGIIGARVQNRILGAAAAHDATLRIDNKRLD